MKFKILDLFCGAGGFSSGLDKIENFETVIGLDFDKYAIETFNNMFPNAIAKYGDITKDKVKADIIDLALKNNVNMIIGGPPCQGFSLKGKNLGLEDPRNFLFKEYAYLVEQIEPEIFIIENVKNMISSGDGFFIEQIQKMFKNMGYKISYGILNSKYFGVPQSRERTIIVGSKNHEININDIELSENLVTVKDAISDLSYLKSGEGDVLLDYINISNSEYQKNMKGRNLQYHKATTHSKETIDKLKMIPPEGNKSHLPLHLHGNQKFSTTWSRLVWDKPSPTIDTRFDTPSNGRNTHPVLNRAITPREAARLQSFHDNFHFSGPKSAVCRQIGNAVPPLMAKAIGKYIIKKIISDTTKIELNNIYNNNCMKLFPKIKDNYIDFTLTDIPYDAVNRKSNGLRNLDKENADILTFNLDDFLNQIYRVTKNSMVIFCGKEQFSFIYDFFANKKGTVRPIIWEKTNPSPMNGQYIYLSGVEMAVWFKKSGSKTFNAHCKNTVFRYPNGRAKLHPTEKNHALLEDLILDNTNEGDIVFDPCSGSGSHLLVAKNLNRQYLGFELNSKYANIALKRI